MIKGKDGRNYYSLKEAAEAAGYDVPLFKQMVGEHKIPSHLYHKEGRNFLFDIERINNWAVRVDRDNVSQYDMSAKPKHVIQFMNLELAPPIYDRFIEVRKLKQRKGCIVAYKKAVEELYARGLNPDDNPEFWELLEAFNPINTDGVIMFAVLVDRIIQKRPLSLNEWNEFVFKGEWALYKHDSLVYSKQILVWDAYWDIEAVPRFRKESEKWTKKQ
jgi:hypothetical protein